MSADDTIVQILSMTNLTRDDVEGLRALTIDELRLVMDAYVDAGKVADRGAWVQIGNALKGAAGYLPLATGILQIVGAVAAL